MVRVYTLNMTLFAVGCVLICYFLHILAASQKGCTFPIHGPNEKRSPLLLQNDSTLAVTSHGKVHLNSREIVSLLCPDPKNYLIGTQSNVSHAQCVGGKILRVANQDANFDDVQCKHIIKGSVLTTSRKCGNNQGRIYKIGYPFTTRHFFPVLEVCYDSNAGTALYTEHLLHGQNIRYASKSSYRPAFSPEAAAVSVSVAYKQAFQKASFNRLLGSALLAHEYINNSSFLSRGHLSPDADFFFAATQYTTYYFINSAPQWQAINSGNWKRIEIMVRKLADSLQETLVVITGIHQVLTLPNKHGRDKEIYLISGGKLPVPKFIWKMVYSVKTKHAVVLVTLNNPFTDGIGADDFICESICDQVGWGAVSWVDYARGFVYCCDYKEFAAEVKTAPKFAVTGVLHGPN